MHQSKLSFAAKNMRKFWGYTSESINCPEGTNDLKVWETLVYRVPQRIQIDKRKIGEYENEILREWSLKQFHLHSVSE